MPEYYGAVGLDGEVEVPEELRATMGMLGDARVFIWPEDGKILLKLAPEDAEDELASA